MLSSINKGLARAADKDNIKEIVDLSHILLQREVRPNLETYNTILRAFGKNQLLEDAWALFSDMEVLGIDPDVESYNYLIQASLRKNNSDRLQLTYPIKCSLQKTPPKLYILYFK